MLLRSLWSRSLVIVLLLGQLSYSQTQIHTCSCARSHFSLQFGCWCRYFGMHLLCAALGRASPKSQSLVVNLQQHIMMSDCFLLIARTALRRQLHVALGFLQCKHSPRIVIDPELVFAVRILKAGIHGLDHAVQWCSDRSSFTVGISPQWNSNSSPLLLAQGHQ